MHTIRVIALVVFASASVVNAGIIQSTFDTGLDGWSVEGSVGEWHSSGGNPDGFAYIDNSEGPVTYMIAPGAFLGDLSATNGGFIFFDAIQLGDGGDPYNNIFLNYGNITISGLFLSATLDLVASTTGPPPAWTTYSAPMTAATWGLTEADWESLLSYVVEIRLSVEGLFGAEIEGVDNFTITPEPASLALALMGSLALIRRRR